MRAHFWNEFCLSLAKHTPMNWRNDCAHLVGAVVCQEQRGCCRAASPSTRQQRWFWTLLEYIKTFGLCFTEQHEMGPKNPLTGKWFCKILNCTSNIIFTILYFMLLNRILQFTDYFSDSCKYIWDDSFFFSATFTH